MQKICIVLEESATQNRNAVKHASFLGSIFQTGALCEPHHRTDLNKAFRTTCKYLQTDASLIAVAQQTAVSFLRPCASLSPSD